MAIACGNTFILKPSEPRSIDANAFGLNCSSKPVRRRVYCKLCTVGKEQVDILLKDKDVKALSFVGSVAVC